MPTCLSKLIGHRCFLWNKEEGGEKKNQERLHRHFIHLFSSNQNDVSAPKKNLFREGFGGDAEVNSEKAILKE